MLAFLIFFLFGGSFFFLFSSNCWMFLSFFFFLLSFLFSFFFFSYGWFEVISFFFVDCLGGCLVMLSLWVCALMMVSSVRSFHLSESSFFFSFCVFFLGFVLVNCFILEDFFLFYIFFELSLVPTLFIILGWGYQPERLQAGLYMMMYTVSASLPFLFLLVFYGNIFCHFSFLFSWFTDAFLFSFLFSFFLFFFLVLVFMVKIPIFFFHLWLPKAHVEAPVSGSMVLAGVLLKLGGYGAMRLFSMMNMFEMIFSDLMIMFVLWGGVITGFICFRQVDLKCLVAYSSVGHMGMFLAGIFSGFWWGWSGGLLMMLGHGLCSSCLFVLSSVGYDLLGTRSMYVVKGLLVFFPYLTMWWFIFVAGNMAGPPSLNLGAELFLLMGILSYSFSFFFFLGILGFLVGGYSLYLFVSLNHGDSLVSFSYFFSPKINFFLVFFLHFFPLYIFFFSIEVLFFYY
uniref:NADH-ubiquinone oxidoreductase chain 4 n=1 Tax=Nectonemertes cf. mirabilis HC-2011 TaxID=992350 RepID=I1SR46_9BILA|nr:NADH dehydrogenase subunit 4 [Nectonemertes cf. mirabilis HC-2011]ADZ05366.1 NADH dehydrogenase subunit 4 [Nectonemertes cf. mirabilis HC-2011]